MTRPLFLFILDVEESAELTGPLAQHLEPWPAQPGPSALCWLCSLMAGGGGGPGCPQEESSSSSHGALHSCLDRAGAHKCPPELRGRKAQR